MGGGGEGELFRVSDDLHGSGGSVEGKGIKDSRRHGHGLMESADSAEKRKTGEADSK